MARAHRSQILAPALLAAGLALLVLAWVFGNPPGAAPDEQAHFVRALGAGNLELAGATFVPNEAQRRAFFKAGRTATPVEGSGVTTLLWAGKLTRTFGVPPALSVNTLSCTDRRPEASAACLDRPASGRRVSRVPLATGAYPPFLYVLPGAAARRAATPAAAVRSGRLISAGLSVALLAFAVALTWAPGGAGAGAALAALALASTPMVLFSASILNASGPEIAGSLCFIAAGLRAGRPGAGPWTWAALALSGVSLTLARSLGPGLLIVLAGTLVALLGLEPARRIARERPRASAAATLAALALAFAAAAWWALFEQPSGVDGGPGLRDALAQAVGDLPVLARHAVGNFGALDTVLPTWLFVLWGAGMAVLVDVAAVLGTGGQRLRLALTGAVALAVTLVLSVFMLRNGYGAQGRHVLPVLVLVPLWCGEILRRRPERLRALVPGVFALFAGGQAVAWWVNARRAAVGTDGPRWFFGTAQWSPPGGWWVWAVVAATGCALALAGGLQAQRSSRSRSRSMPPSSATAPA